MSKAVVRIGHRDYVMAVEKALLVCEVLAEAELYESKWHKEVGTTPSHYTYHVYRREHDDKFNLEIIGERHYQMSKLAGAPPND